jgi:hypothetical protein
MPAACKTKKSGLITIRITQAEAEAMDLVRCECGHRHNNHFDWDNQPCAHCACMKYTQQILVPTGNGRSRRVVG